MAPFISSFPTPSRNFLRGALFAPLLAIAPALLLGNTAWADQQQGPVKLLTTIPIPPTATNGPKHLYSYDISFVDQKTQMYYLADRDNNVVDVIDARTDAFVGQLTANPPFAGFVDAVTCAAKPGGNAGGSCVGPNGVLASGNFLFVTDGNSRVVTINLTTGATVGDVKTKAGDPNRADELAYDPHDGIILSINNADTIPFGALIGVNKTTGALTVLKTIPFTHATNGVEQPIWNPADGRFYLSVPELDGVTTAGAVYRIHPTTGLIEVAAQIDFCSPAGLSLGPDHTALIGCNKVFDVKGATWVTDGNITANPQDVILNLKTGEIKHVFDAGAGDEVWYNSGDGKYYATGSGSPYRPLPAATAFGATPMAVIDAETGEIVQTLSTYNTPAVGTHDNATEHPAGTSHSVAANAKNNHVFVPFASNNAYPDCLTGCIAVFGPPAEDHEHAADNH
jgi:hypothetical protein